MSCSSRGGAGVGALVPWRSPLRNICLIDGCRRCSMRSNSTKTSRASTCSRSLFSLWIWAAESPPHANAVFNEYLARTADLGGLPLLPLFLSCRAAVRAKTSVTALNVQSDERQRRDLQTASRQYLALAQEFLRPPPPCLIAVGGLSGSGKSTLARALAPAVGSAPGALILRSDVIRKALLGRSLDSARPRRLLRRCREMCIRHSPSVR